MKIMETKTKKCDFCGENKEEHELTFLYNKQKFICKDCENENKLKDEDDYLEYMYSTNGSDR